MAVKIKCALPIDVVRDLGYTLRPGETNNTALVRLVSNLPYDDIRPCARYQAWVVKEEACPDCKYCVEVIR